MEMATEKHAAAAEAEATSTTASGRSRGDRDETEQVAAPKLADGDKAEAGKGKRIGKVSQKYIDMILKEKATGLGKVSQKYIDMILKEKATGTGLYRKRRSMEIFEQFTGPRNRKEELRALVAQGEAIIDQLWAGDDAILEQYHRLGYAYTEVEEDNSFIYDEKIFGPIARSRPRLPPA